MIDTAIYQIISGDSGVSALVGSEVYIGVNPDPGALYITIQGIQHLRPANIDFGASKQHAGFQVDVYGKLSPSVSDLSEAVVSATHYKTAVADGHSIQFMRVENERSNHEPETKLFRKSLDISLFFD